LPDFPPPLFGLCPADGGVCEFREVFFGAERAASSSLIRAACASINAA